MLDVKEPFSSPAALKGEIVYECFIEHTSLNYTEEKRYIYFKKCMSVSTGLYTVKLRIFINLSIKATKVV